MMRRCRFYWQESSPLACRRHVDQGAAYGRQCSRLIERHDSNTVTRPAGPNCNIRK
jgi:hypothetical protein